MFKSFLALIWLVEFRTSLGFILFLLICEAFAIDELLLGKCLLILAKSLSSVRLCRCLHRALPLSWGSWLLGRGLLAARHLTSCERHGCGLL